MDGPGFIPGMRAKGECPKHPGQPFYHCGECAKERQQNVGATIVAELEDAHHQQAGQSAALLANPHPVHITTRALDHLTAHCRDFRRSRVEGKVQALRERLNDTSLSPTEVDAARNRLTELESSISEEDVAKFDVMPIVFLDITGVSGIHPKVELCEPSQRNNFEKDFTVYDYGPLRVGVELRYMNYLRGLIVDWHDRLDASGFVIRHQKGDWCFEDR